MVIVATRGAYRSKPRPALVVQSDAFNPTHTSVTICPITSDCLDAPLFRISLPAARRTGLAVASQVMVATRSSACPEKSWVDRLDGSNPRSSIRWGERSKSGRPSSHASQGLTDAQLLGAISLDDTMFLICGEACQGSSG